MECRGRDRSVGYGNGDGYSCSMAVVAVVAVVAVGVVEGADSWNTVKYDLWWGI